MAIELLDKQLSARAKKGQYGFIVLSSATDPYLQFEKEEKLTRGILEIILKHRFPVHIITKSDLVIRDLDILRRIAETAILPADLEEKSVPGVLITFSFSTIDDTVARIFEPGATPPSLRLQTLKFCIQQQFFCGVSMMPLLPYISDTGANLELMLGAFKDAGANYVFPATITLFGAVATDSKALVFRAIEKHYPDLTEKYQRLFFNSTELPAYYRSAFRDKIKTLLIKYDLKDRIA